jgi:hypothetical protein
MSEIRLCFKTDDATPLCATTSHATSLCTTSSYAESLCTTVFHAESLCTLSDATSLCNMLSHATLVYATLSHATSTRNPYTQHCINMQTQSSVRWGTLGDLTVNLKNDLVYETLKQIAGQAGDHHWKERFQ